MYILNNFIETIVNKGAEKLRCWFKHTQLVAGGARAWMLAVRLQV